LPELTINFPTDHADPEAEHIPVLPPS
jgi:hypothetical protein